MNKATVVNIEQLRDLHSICSHGKWSYDGMRNEINTVESENWWLIISNKTRWAEKGLGGETVFCNPPYGREQEKWIEKCCYEALKADAKVVMLMAAKEKTIEHHKCLYKQAKIDFLKGRLKLSGHKNSAPFPSMIVVFDAALG